MRGKILQIIAKNSKLTPQEIAVLINEKPEDVAKEIKFMEEKRVICGYNTLINWDNTDRELVTALIEVKVTPQRGEGYDKIAERIYRFEEVKAVYLMSGGFDLTVMLEEKSLKEIAFFVSDKLATIDAVTGTSTHFVLKNYKDHGIVIERGEKADRRMKISP
jgi:Transcriptional regulators